jgi:hypothetical protein
MVCSGPFQLLQLKVFSPPLHSSTSNHFIPPNTTFHHFEGSNDNCAKRFAANSQVEAVFTVIQYACGVLNLFR